MLPLLNLAADGKEHTVREAVETLADQLTLTDEDRRDPLPSRAQPRFDNRVGWARTYLTKAGLLASAGRGSFHITTRGQEVLAREPTQIGSRDLEQYPEFPAFTGRSRPDPLGPAEKVSRTPEEVLEAGYADLRSALAQELLENVRGSSPSFFEQLVVELLVAMGYGGSRTDAGQAIGQSGDGGVDGIIKEDRLGLDVIYIQAKRWQHSVGRPELQGFVGSLEGHRARKGVFITTSRFSREAMDYSERTEKKVVLINGEQLAELMIDFGVGVQDVSTYTVKRVDSDYFNGGS